ncbi:MAG: SusE domain-containing protein [Prevotellaceae bacterium]|jgi:hypothetical protein|nr:SusE domain-containing protein [Prevotellaceae bacterium]
MKTIFNTLFIALTIACFSLAGCKDEMEYSNSGVSPATPVWPEEGAAIALYNSDVASLDFKWEAADAAGAPYYQIVFYAADRTTELYRVAPTDRQLLVAVPHKTLNLIANMAGIAPSAAGDVYWAIASVKGTMEDISAARKLTLQSYRVFDDLPVSLYVAGDVAEGGADVAAAPKFRAAGEGEYEVYTHLRAGGGFYFTNKNSSGGGRSFTAESDFLVETTGAPSAPLTVSEDGVYHITASFITGAVTVTGVSNVRYFVPSADTYTPMTYDGYGKWSLHVALGSLTSDNNKYKFVATVGGTDRSWGCSAQGGQANPPQILEGDYFYVYQNDHSAGGSNELARYSYRYMTELANQEVDLLLDMSSDNDHYTHAVDAGDLTVYPVEQLNEPDENASVALSKVSGSSLTFSWKPSSGTGPTPKYDVIFYSDAEGTNEIGTAAADNNRFTATATVLHAAVESISAAAGIPAEGVGDIWWSVRTTVLTQSEIAATSPRKLTVTRLPGIPAAVYITGAASEAGATLGDAVALKKTEPGIFEIYTKLTSGSAYYFVDAATGTPRQFSVSGTSIVEGGAIEVDATAVYKITLNFNTDVAAYKEITGVGIWPCSDEVVLIPLTYSANGVWSATDYTTGNANTDWGNARYKIRMDSPEGNTWWITANGTDSPPGDNPNPSYFYMRETSAYTQWDDKWKINGEFGNATFDVSVSLNVSEPTHLITRK